jgi:inhibitor-of-growth protein 1
LFPLDITSEIEKIAEQLQSASADKKSRLRTRLNTILLKLRELKDEKIHLSQLLAANIESSYKTVVDSLQSSVQVKIERSVSPTPSLTKNISTTPQNYTNNIVKPSAPSNASSETNSASESQEKGAKRARKTRIDNLDMDDDDDPLPPVSTSSKITNQSSQLNSNAAKRAANANANKQKTKKRKTTKKQSSALIAQETIDEIILDDPDETTYCICQQISYGEMVCCENDACPIEWFHFSCVDLVSKPKGRW